MPPAPCSANLVRGLAGSSGVRPPAPRANVVPELWGAQAPLAPREGAPGPPSQDHTSNLRVSIRAEASGPRVSSDGPQLACFPVPLLGAGLGLVSGRESRSPAACRAKPSPQLSCRGAEGGGGGQCLAAPQGQESRRHGAGWPGPSRGRETGKGLEHGPGPRCGSQGGGGAEVGAGRIPPARQGELDEGTQQKIRPRLPTRLHCLMKLKKKHKKNTQKNTTPHFIYSASAPEAPAMSPFSIPVVQSPARPAPPSRAPCCSAPPRPRPPRTAARPQASFLTILYASKV